MKSRVNRHRHHGKYKGNARVIGGGEPLTDVLHYKPPVIRHQGITRHAERKAPPQRPLTARHLDILATLSDEPQGQTEIGRALGLRGTQVTSALYVLQNRGLARHIGMGKGWVRTDAQTAAAA